MTRIATFRDRVRAGDALVGTFLKTPAFQLVEVLAGSGLDFLCLDAEHAPFDRAAMDACIGIGCALDLPMLVRVADGSAREILQALDLGAAGIVVPHVTDAARAEAAARAARFGLHGRGYAGSTRWAGYGTRAMPDLLARSARETTLFAQIEEPEGVEAAASIAAVPGVDALFLGPADLSVGYGHDRQDNADVARALEIVGAAARAAGLGYASFMRDGVQARDWRAAHGVTVAFIGSEHGWMRAGANADADAAR